jgi:PncC family amidohydrolase
MSDFAEHHIEELHECLRNADQKLAVAESCTGGLIGGAITSVPGSSDVFEGGVIAYTNAIKRKELHVSGATLDKYGAVSEPVARQMVDGLCASFEVPVGISVSGIAGPSGGTEEKPVGLVYAGIRVDEQVDVIENVFEGDRATVRERTVRTVLEELLNRL